MRRYLRRDGDEGRPLVKAPSARTCPIKWAQLNWSVMYLWTLDSICEKRFFHSFTITQNMPWNTRNIDNLSLKYWPSDFCSLNLSHPDGSLLGQGWIIFTCFMAINLVIIRKQFLGQRWKVPPDRQHNILLPGDLEVQRIHTGGTVWPTFDIPGWEIEKCQQMLLHLHCVQLHL